MRGGRFVDGECDLGISVVWDMMAESNDPPRVQADRLGITRKHLYELAVLVCAKLSIPDKRVRYWLQMFRLQKEREP